MPAFVDFTGRVFGRLTVLGRAPNRPGSKRVRWACLCECGKETSVAANKLVSGHTQSCGCLNIETVIARSTRHGYAKRTDTSPTYVVWTGIIDRCLRPKNKRYADYGGRGITICDRWRHSFENFLADMGPRPSLQHSIDRYPDKNGNYEPGNCRWATDGEQARNKRSNRQLTFAGETHCIAEWSERCNIPSSVIRSRIDKCGWSVERALTTAMKKTGHAAMRNIEH